MFARLRLLKILAAVLLFSFVPMVLSSTPARGAAGFAFTTLELGRFDVPGVSCPGSTTGFCWNVNAEQQIRADPAGNFYASSEYLPRVAQCRSLLDLLNPQCGGTGAWKSSDNGLHYVTLPSPNTITADCSSFPCQTSFSPYGGDTDLATATRTNANGLYNVYVVSLERATGPLLTVELSTSSDGGQTWTVNPTSIQAPINDRPWVAAEGSNKVCVSSHNIATAFVILVSCSFDGGLTFPQVASAFDSNHLFLANFNTGSGNIAIDQNNHVIYDTFTGLANANEAVADQLDANCVQFGVPNCPYNFHVVYLAVSIDGGKSFTDHPVFFNPNVKAHYAHQFSSVSVDKRGTVYVAYSDDHNTYYSFSTTFGQTWSQKIQINSAPANTAIFPWVTAGSEGMIDVVYYGTSFDGTATPTLCSQQPCTPDNYPSSAAWHVYFAQSLNAPAASPTFLQTQATSIIHYGGVCEAGIACSGNRDLFDDFGVAASPTTGLASIVFSDDQFVNSPNEPPSPTCTQSKTNTGPCDHTDIATQTSGTAIFQKEEGFEIEQEDHETSPNGGPEFDIQITNTANQGITSIAVHLGGATLTLNWSPSTPLPPGARASSSTVSIPLTLSLVLGQVYAGTVTATFADGSTVTQSFAAIYTPIMGPF